MDIEGGRGGVLWIIFHGYKYKYKDKDKDKYEYKYKYNYVLTRMLQEILMLSAAERQELAENAMEQLARLVNHNIGKVVLHGGKLQGGIAKWYCKVVLQGAIAKWYCKVVR